VRSLKIVWYLGDEAEASVADFEHGLIPRYCLGPGWWGVVSRFFGQRFSAIGLAVFAPRRAGYVECSWERLRRPPGSHSGGASPHPDTAVSLVRVCGGSLEAIDDAEWARMAGALSMINAGIGLPLDAATMPWPDIEGGDPAEHSNSPIFGRHPFGCTIS
jgi:hypothetical protein